MSSALRHRASGSAAGWWASAARALALLLALVVSAPVAGLADDIAFHVGSGADFAEMTVGGAADADAADPGLAGHVHCGCHQAAGLTHHAALSPPAGSQAIVVVPVLALTSIPSNRLPRPPRA